MKAPINPYNIPLHNRAQRRAAAAADRKSGKRITGYEYEPWHLRYVGLDVATDMHDRGITTLEDYWGLPPAPTYAG